MFSKTANTSLATKKLQKLFNEFFLSYGKKRNPKSFVLRITDKCNLNCCYCSVNARGREELRKEEIFNLIDDLAEMKLKRVVLSGGEPLIRKEFFEIVKKLSAKRISFKLNTSGYFLNEEIAKQLKKYNCRTIQISVLGKEKTHDKLKGKKSWQKAIDGIKFCREQNITTLLSTIALRSNLNEIQYLANLSKELNCYFYLKRFHPVGRVAKDEIITREEYRNIINFLYNFYGKELVSSFAKYSEKLNGTCIAFSSLCINANGKVFPCAELPIEIGNIKNQSIEEIWNNLQSLELYKKFYNKEINGKCQNCKIKLTCGCGCRADAFGIYGNAFAEDPYCWRSPKDEDIEKTPLLNMLGLFFGWL